MCYLPADYMQYGSTEEVKVLKFEQKFETQYKFNLTRTQPYTEFYGYYSFPTMITYFPTKELHEYSRPTRTSLRKYVGKPAVHISLWNCHDTLDGWSSDQVAASRASKFMQAGAAYHASPAEVVCQPTSVGGDITGTCDTIHGVFIRGLGWMFWPKPWCFPLPSLFLIVQLHSCKFQWWYTWLQLRESSSRGLHLCLYNKSCNNKTLRSSTFLIICKQVKSSLQKKKSECKELVLVTYDCIMQLHSNIKKDYK